MKSFVTIGQLRLEAEAQRMSVEPDDGVTRTRQACEDLLAEMSYVLAEAEYYINEELDVSPSWRTE
jgi:hypothetical protein